MSAPVVEAALSISDSPTQSGLFVVKKGVGAGTILTCVTAILEQPNALVTSTWYWPVMFSCAWSITGLCWAEIKDCGPFQENKAPGTDCANSIKWSFRRPALELAESAGVGCTATV